jgi:hypothetical protein
MVSLTMDVVVRNCGAPEFRFRGHAVLATCEQAAEVWLKAPTRSICAKAGAANRTRTCDPVITNDVLYQLSYCGEPCDARENAPDKRPHLISATAAFCKKNAAIERAVIR